MRSSSFRTESITMNPRNLLLIFMVAAYPLLVIPGPLDWFRGPRYILLAVVSLIAFYLLLKERIRLDRPAYIPLAFFLFFALVSTLLADNITMAWMEDGSQLQRSFTQDC